MFAACLLLLLAITSGTAVTFLFDRQMPRGARLCMGAALGLALWAIAGFLLSLALGLNRISIGLSVLVVLLPFLLFWNAGYRALFLNLDRARPPQGASASIGYVAFYFAIAILLGMVFGRAAFTRPDGIYTGITNNLGDLPLHLQIINSFAQGANLPPEDPTYAGVRFAYPFLVDFEAAMLVRAGADVISAMWLQNMALALALTGLIHYWTLLLTRNRLAGVIAPLLVLFSGGLGWLLFENAEGGILSHDYTILPNSILRWGNSLTTLFVPQRSILFGVPLAIFIFSQWWLVISQPQDLNAKPMEKPEAGKEAAASRKGSATSRRRRDSRKAKVSGLPDQPRNINLRRMLAAGIFAGLLPLIHAHTFLVVMGVSACLAFLFPHTWRNRLAFFVVALAIGLPGILWLAHSGVNTRSYLGWQPGWDHADHNILWFWFVNTGLFIPLLIFVLVGIRGFALPRQVVKYYVPFIFCFIVPNLVRVAPWIWDNIKVLFFWWLASTPLVAWLLARWWRQRSPFRWIAPVVLLSLLLAGGLDVARVIAAKSEYQEFDAGGMAVATIISDQLPPRSVILHAPGYNSPVFLTGRRSLLGYPGWMWSRGLDYSQRAADIQAIYSGRSDANALMRAYAVNYVLLGPAEIASYTVNEPFWARQEKLAQSGAYRLYRFTTGEE